MAPNKSKKDKLNIKNIYAGLINHTNDNLRFDTNNYLWHPTRIPLVIGFIWFIFIGSAQVNNNQGTVNSDQFILVLLIPLLILIGISGLITIVKGESVGKFGRIQRGFWAYVNGVLGVVFGWGLSLIFLLAAIFKW